MCSFESQVMEIFGNFYFSGDKSALNSMNCDYGMCIVLMNMNYLVDAANAFDAFNLDAALKVI